MEIEFQEAVDAEARMLDRVPSLKVDGARVHPEVDAGPLGRATACR